MSRKPSIGLPLVLFVLALVMAMLPPAVRITVGITVILLLVAGTGWVLARCRAQMRAGDAQVARMEAERVEQGQQFADTVEQWLHGHREEHS